MKRVCFAVIIVIAYFIVGCSKPGVEVSTKTEELPAIGTVLNENGENKLHYQGYIEFKTVLKEDEYKSLEMFTVKNIKFEENKNGIPVMYRYNATFNYEALKVVYDAYKSGNIYDCFEYTPEQFGNFGLTPTENGEYITKLQYVLMEVEPDAKKEDIKRKVTLELEYKFKNGKKVEKSEEVMIP